MKDSENITRLVYYLTGKPIDECIILQRILLTNWDTIKRSVERELSRGKQNKKE